MADTGCYQFCRQGSNDIIINNSDNNKSLNLFSSLLNAFLIKKRSDSGERCRLRLFDKDSLFNKTEGEMQRIES